MRGNPNRKLDPVVPYIILYPEEEEEEIAPNRRAVFKERHCKRLSEVLSAAPSPTKKTRPEASRDVLVPDAFTAQVPLFDTMRSKQELVASSSVKKDACPMKNRDPCIHSGWQY